MKFWEFLSTIFFWLSLPFYYIERVIHKKSGGWKEKFGYVENLESDKVIMLHGCSVGEIVAVEDMAKKIKEAFPDYKLVVTTSTLTGQDIAKKKLSQTADYITFFPFDIPICVNKFLERISPSLVLIAETEIWPNFAYGCRKNNIPLFIINGRISDLSYKSYRFAKPFFKMVFKNYTAIFTQSREDKEKFISIGNLPEKTEFMGNLKFGITKNEADVEIGQNGYRILLAGSTHKQENPIIINTFIKLKKDFADLKLLIAPRHLERVGEIEALCTNSGLKFGNRLKGDKFDKETDVIILDTLGELKNMYAVSHLAYIGGSFNNTGGHNPLEAIIWEKPVFSGPKIFNFKDIYGILTSAGAASVVKTEDELYHGINEALSGEKYEVMQKACANVFDEQRGAADFVISKMKEVL